jgi:hypothetical protein
MPSRSKREHKATLASRSRILRPSVTNRILCSFFFFIEDRGFQARQGAETEKTSVDAVAVAAAASAAADVVAAAAVAADQARQKKKAQKWAMYLEKKSWGRGSTEEETAEDMYSPFD